MPPCLFFSKASNNSAIIAETMFNVNMKNSKTKFIKRAKTKENTPLDIYWIKSIILSKTRRKSYVYKLAVLLITTKIKLKK